MTRTRKPLSKQKNEDDDPTPAIGVIGLASTSRMLDPVLPWMRVVGEITQDTAIEFADSVRELQTRGVAKALLEISSEGGCLFSLFQMLNTMDASDITFVTYNSSLAYSAGGVLLAAGAPGARIAAPLSSTMLHSMASGISLAPIDDLMLEAAHSKDLYAILLKRLAADMRTTPAKLLKFLKEPSDGGASTRWMTPEQALAAGVVDIIGIPTFTSEVSLSILTPKAATPAKSKERA